MLNKYLTASFKLGASAVALMAVVGASSAAFGDELETVTVTGYRASLEKAMDIKRNSLDASDSILAEDIGKFPDMNVSESLQRIPGVALNRESGEGREITVRGLGAQFTRVLINGIEAVATVGSQDVSTSNPGSGAGGANRGRGFDFNVFASDLFTALTVHKSNSASLEEGSLGATVQLQTARPFDHPGFLFTTSAQVGYQTMAGSTNPRIAAMVSNTFFGGRFGVLLSAAYGTTNTLEQGTSSVRWMSQIGNSTAGATQAQQTAIVPSGANNNVVLSVNGQTCANSATAPVSQTASSPADCYTFNTAFRPRFPRYDIVGTHSKRLGLTGSVQWQPDDATLFTVDALYADFAQIRNENYLEANSFSSGANANATYSAGSPAATYHVTSMGTRSMNILSYSLVSGQVGTDSNLNASQTVGAVTATNVGLRSEHRLDHLDTRFMQVTLDGKHDFSEKFKMHLLAGWSESHHRNPIQTTLAMDFGCAGAGATAGTGCGAGSTTDPYSFDYTEGNMPMLHVGSTANGAWFLSNVRERAVFVSNSYRSASLDFSYKANKYVTLTGGFDYRNFGFSSLYMLRSTGGTGELATIPDAVRAVDINTYVKTVSLKGMDVPSGSTTSWLVPDLDKAASAINLFDPTVFPLNAAPGYGSNGTVRENDYAAWIQADWDTEVAGMGLRGNIGARYVETVMGSTGWSLAGSTLTPRTGKNVYHDWLPALNVVLSPLDDFQVRFNASYALTRPGLTGMMPTGSASVSGSNMTASRGNPALPPTRSKNLDLAFEWYYVKGSMISVAGFWKHLDNFIQTATLATTWDKNPFGWTAESFVGACGGSGTNWASITNTYCIGQGGATANWTFSYSTSVKGAPLYGTEINWQQQFYFLPGMLENFGVSANYTYVQAQQSYFDTTGKLLMKADLNNMSRTSYNGTFYYDDQVFQARIAGSFRSHYLVDPNIATNYNNYGIFVKSTFNVDASASYKLNESLMFTFDAMNLTNQASNIYADKNAQRSYQFHKTGQVFYLGAKYTY